MSKTVETARRHVFKEDVLHNHIAETYFRQKTRPKSRKKKQALRINIDFARLLITAAIITVLTLFISISAVFLHGIYINVLQKNVAAMKVIKVINNGSPNRTVVKKIQFLGNARKGASGSIKNAVILVNPKKYNWADLAMDFRFPIDISRRSLLISMRGSQGGEKVNLVLRDSRNVSFRINDISLSSDMHEITVHPKDLVGDLDFTKINHLRIECGKPGESVAHKDSPIKVTAYINNLSLLKEG